MVWPDRLAGNMSEASDPIEVTIPKIDQPQFIPVGGDKYHPAIASVSTDAFTTEETDSLVADEVLTDFIEGEKNCKAYFNIGAKQINNDSIFIDWSFYNAPENKEITDYNIYISDYPITSLRELKDPYDSVLADIQTYILAVEGETATQARPQHALRLTTEWRASLPPTPGRGQRRSQPA